MCNLAALETTGRCEFGPQPGKGWEPLALGIHKALFTSCLSFLSVTAVSLLRTDKYATRTNKELGVIILSQHDIYYAKQIPLIARGTRGVKIYSTHEL
jgi:hypothetical protein